MIISITYCVFWSVDTLKIKLFVFILLFSLQQFAEAQIPLPLIINIDGQVYRWLPGETDLIHIPCDLQGNTLRQGKNSLLLSNDGQWVAFMALPEGIAEGAPSPTGNLWLCNVESGEAYALSNQTPEQTGAVSDGIFSPDGQFIIWTELVDYTSSNVTLFVHNLMSRETRSLVESLGLGEYCGAGSYAPPVIWGKHGIGLTYSIVDDVSCDGYEDYGFSYYAIDGTLINSFLVSRQLPGNFRWLDSDEPRIVFLRNAENMPNAQVFSINMLTGEMREEVGTLEAFLAVDDSATVILPIQNYSSRSVHIKFSASAQILTTTTDVAISPDGMLVAIIIDRALYFATNANITPAPWNMIHFPIVTENDELHLPALNIGQFEVAWAEPIYRLVSEPEHSCPTVIPLKFTDVAYVVDGLGDNNVREAPDSNAKVIGSLPEGAKVFVIPEVKFYRPQVEICSGGIRWREIFYEGQLAWTAESQGSTYYLRNQ